MLTLTQGFLPRTLSLSLSGERFSILAKIRTACALGAVLFGMTITGCGGNSASTATAGAISILNAAGMPAKVSVVAVASTLKLNMAPVGDKIDAGVDWTVTCGGHPVSGSVVNGACGTFTPAHTADGAATIYTAPSVIPINNSITLTATITSNPSQTSSVSLTVIAVPIAVSLSGVTNGIPGPVTATLNTNATTPLNVTVTNDPLNAGVIFTATCGSAACGSFNPAQAASSGSSTYTAPSVVPAGGNVTITATSLTDTTKTASATVAITTPATPAGITVAVLPAVVYVETVGSAHRTNLTAIVTNDMATAGVDWSVSCSASDCGSITAHTASGEAATYGSPSTVPTGGTATITAKSTSNPAAMATATANITTTAPIVVTQSSPPPAALLVGSQAMLVAIVASDANDLGVDWTATCATSGACGTFNLSPAHTASGGEITYTAPAAVPGAGGVVTIIATSSAASTSTPANPAVAVTTITPLSPVVSLTQTPPAFVVAASQTPVTATVMNDVAPGGVLWSVQCGSSVPGGCGFVNPAQTASGATAVFTAPPVASSNPVTITATSVADPAANATSNAITINPNTTLSISFIPSLPSQVQPGATVNLTAAVANDTSNAGVDWQICPSGCGFFTIKPAITANPAKGILPVAPVTATSVSGWSNGLPISFTAPVQVPASGSITIAALAHADNTRANSGIITVTEVLTGPVLNGTVLAGSTPVTGGSVSLMAASTSGYAAAASQVGAGTTDKNGRFTIPAGYTCPSPASEMYLVAVGGAVAPNAANPNLSLMTALGSCSNLSSSQVVVNEVTTVASVVPLAPFSANDALNGNSSALYLGTSSSNSIGLLNAFAAVNNLVDISSGQARYATPVGNATVPYVEINTLADALNACTATSGGVEGDGSACGALFNAADVLPASQLIPNVIAPADTLQAAFNIAQHPIGNYGYLLNVAPLAGLATATSPFQPILTTPPNDWSVSLNYTSGGGLSAASTVGSFAADASGNLWITDTTANSAIEWNAVGAALSPSTGFPAGGGPIAIDAVGDIWISGDSKLNELTSLGSPAPGSPFKGVSGGGSDLAIDAQSNLWIANGTGVSEFSNLGVAISPAGGFVNDSVTLTTGVGVDSSNNIWLGNSTQNNFAELTNPGGNLIVNSTQGGLGTLFPQLAADGAGDIWADSGAGSVCEVKPYAGQGFLLIPNCSGPTVYNLFSPKGLAFDGAGTLWIASQGGGSNPTILPSVLPLAPSLTTNSTNFLASPSLTAGTLRVAVDGSGNTWVLLQDNTVTEYVGVATPVVTPLALGVQNNKLAAKP